MITYVVAIICVLGIAVGQILFKLGALSLNVKENVFDVKTWAILIAAFLLYGLTSLAWIWVLQKAELGKVYPLMALAFILVPIGSHIFFGERFVMQYFVGVALIMAGIVTAVRA